MIPHPLIQEQYLHELFLFINLIYNKEKKNKPESK